MMFALVMIMMFGLNFYIAIPLILGHDTPCGQFTPEELSLTEIGIAVTDPDAARAELIAGVEVLESVATLADIQWD